MPTYQSAAAPLAAAPDPMRVVQDAARRILRSARAASERDRQLLWDVQRGRYPMVALFRAAEVAASCEDDGDALALPELLRGFIVARRAPGGLCVLRAYVEESERQGEADVAQFRFLVNRCRASADGAVEALLKHHAAIRTAIDAHHAQQAGGGVKAAA